MEAFLAGNTDPCLEYVLIPIKMNCCITQMRDAQLNSGKCSLICYG